MTQFMVERMRRLAAADVRRVRHHARAVITIGQQGAVSFVRNDQQDQQSDMPILDVVAVVGPTVHEGISLPEAVLCEVGLHRTHPYARSERRGTGPVRPYLSLIQPRDPRFTMTAWQYRLAAPALFSFLDGWMHEIIRRWFWGPWASFRIWRTFVRRPKFTLQQSDQVVSQPRGSRISVARKDLFLCADLFRVEMNDPFWQEQLQGLACLVELALTPLESGYREPFKCNKEAREVREMLQVRMETSMPAYIMAKLPSLFGSHRKSTSRLVREATELVADVTGTRNGDLSWQERVAASALPGFRNRTCRTIVRDISSLRNGGDKPYVVFELLPEARKKFERPQAKRRS